MNMCVNVYTDGCGDAVFTQFVIDAGMCARIPISMHSSVRNGSVLCLIVLLMIWVIV